MKSSLTALFVAAGLLGSGLTFAATPAPAAAATTPAAAVAVAPAPVAAATAAAPVTTPAKKVVAKHAVKKTHKAAVEKAPAAM